MIYDLPLSWVLFWMIIKYLRSYLCVGILQKKQNTTEAKIGKLCRGNILGPIEPPSKCASYTC